MAKTAKRKAGHGKERARCQSGKTAKRKTAETDVITVLRMGVIFGARSLRKFRGELWRPSTRPCFCAPDKCKNDLDDQT